MSSKIESLKKQAKTGPASIVVIGGTGLVGKHVCRQLLESGYKVVIASRNELHGRSFESTIARTPDQRKRLRFIAFDASLEPHEGRDRPMFDALRACKAIIMAGGEPLIGSGGRQASESAVQTALSSRTRIVTRVRGLLERIQELRKSKNKSTKSKTKRSFILLSSGAVYGYPKDFSAASVSESSQSFDDVWSQESLRTEAAATSIESLTLMNYRVVSLRLPLVLEQSGGILGSLLSLYKWGLGAPLGEGKFSWFPWIHIYDVVRLIMSALETETFVGPLNCTAGTVTHLQLAKVLASRTGSTLWSWKQMPEMVVQGWLGKPAAMVLSGRRMDSSRLAGLGFTFEFDDIGLALNDLLSLHEEQQDEEQQQENKSNPTAVVDKENLASLGNGVIPAAAEKVLSSVKPRTVVTVGLSAFAVASMWRLWNATKGDSSDNYSYSNSSSSYSSSSNEKVYIGDIVSGLITFARDAKR